MMRSWSVLIWPLFFVTVALGQRAEPAAELRAQIDALIADLGADEYEVREAAEIELSKMGLAAFESLIERRNDKDIEIRLRSRHIVDSLRGQFLVSGVDKQAVVWLKEYASLDESVRLERIGSLSKLLPEAGSDALARVARFEADERLSRAAALSILSVPILSDKPRPSMAKAIVTGIGFSDRTSVRWLRNYADACQAGGSSAEAWFELIKEEQRRNLSLEESEELRDSNCQALRKVALDVARANSEPEHEKTLTDEIVARLANDDAYEEWLRWLQTRNQWDSIVKFSVSHPQLFSTQPWMMYGLAEAKKQLGELDEAERLAESALNHEDSDSGDHYSLGFQLKGQRGQFKWAEAEYRACIETSTNVEPDYYFGVVWLGELLHDMQRDEEAADLLQAVLDDLKAPTKADRQDKEKLELYQEKVRALQRAQRLLKDVRSKAAYFRACHYRTAGELENELESLESGIKQAQDDVDILIAMYTVKDPTDAWKKMTSQKILAVNTNYRDRIRKALVNFEQGRNRKEQREVYGEDLAMFFNQYAWLVGNTEGDIEEAIRNSHKSLELSPGSPGYLDTLGRCYYRAGKLEEALRYQQMAVDRAPHELQIQRQLTLIENAMNRGDAKISVSPKKAHSQDDRDAGLEEESDAPASRNAAVDSSRDGNR